MFNPQPTIQRVPMTGAAGSEHSAWVVDNVLTQPMQLRQHASDHAHLFSTAPHNAYPGQEWAMDDDVSAPLADYFMQHLRGLLGGRRTLAMYSRLSLATLQPQQLRPLQRLCHRDRLGTEPGQGVAACVIYLFDDPALGGTAFYRPRRPVQAINADFARWNTLSDDAFTQELGAAPAYLTAGNTHFDHVCTVPALFNRAVFYDGAQFHSSHITQPERLSADPARGRLTLNGFFITQLRAR